MDKFIFYFQNSRIIPKETQLNKFHLVDLEIDPDDKKLYTLITNSFLMLSCSSRWPSFVSQNGNLPLSQQEI